MTRRRGRLDGERLAFALLLALLLCTAAVGALSDNW